MTPDESSSLHFLHELLDTPSPAGMEDDVRFLLNRYLSPYAHRFHTDMIGNSYAVINEQATFKVMITAHQDEVSAQIIRIDDRGFATFRNSGGPNWMWNAGSLVHVINRKKQRIPGVVFPANTTAISRETFQPGNMYLDIGAKDRQSAEKLIAPGDYIVTAPSFCQVADNRIISKSLDDKIGIYIAAQAFRTLAANPPKDIGIYVVGASQEEVGSRGAWPAAYSINPTVGIAIDVSHASDYPGADTSRYPDFSLGGGIGIYRNANNTPRLLDRVEDIAKTRGIRYQLTPHYAPISSTDASVFQINRGGAATMLLGIPNRYMHSNVEMVDMDDVKQGIDLLVALVSSFRPSDSFLPPIAPDK